jgi:hypothetical protein
MSTTIKSGKKSFPTDSVTSHNDFNFCNTQFADYTDEEIIRLKNRMTSFKNEIKSRKELEFFRMVLLSFQMVNRKNKKLRHWIQSHYIRKYQKSRKFHFIVTIIG